MKNNDAIFLEIQRSTAGLFLVRTIDGHRITFGEEVSSGLFETFMEKLDSA